MKKNILVINAGSSSLKYQLLDVETEQVLAKGLCERIGLSDSKMKHSAHDTSIVTLSDMPNHKEAIRLVLAALQDPATGVIKSVAEIAAVGHRVVNCGDHYAESVLIDAKVKEAIVACFELSPLHNPANLTGIMACEDIMPEVPMVAVFDTAFHQTMPAEAYMYGLPYEYYEKYGVRRYGAHGTSHRFVSERAAAIIGKPYHECRLVTLHLGNGSSLAAVKNGKCIDTSMGMTPLSGPLMGTRCGDIDPAIVPFLMEREKLSPSEMDNLMNKKSGVSGISGVSSDFRDLWSAAEAGNARAQLALDMFAYQCKRIMGAYITVMGGADAIVFTAGVGENDAGVRASICTGLTELGLDFDAEKNATSRGVECYISKAGSRIPILIVPTNEELMIARDTAKLAKL